MLKFLKKIFHKLFYFQQWNIGIIDADISCFIYDFQPKINWLAKPSGLKFFADPFSFRINNCTYVLFEEYCQISKRGKIMLAELLENSNKQKFLGKKKLLLDNFKHLSYPFVFYQNNDIFLLCESYKTKNLILYQIDTQNLQAAFVKEIFSHHEAIDPTLFFYNNTYWLFYTKTDQPNSHLYLAYSQSLQENFMLHPQNPIKVSKASTRPAGNIFIVNNKIYRPAQNCTNTYGESIVINEITHLTNQFFSEQEVAKTNTKHLNSYNLGMHTIAKTNLNDKNYTLVDGYQNIFVIYKPLISLFRNILRKFK